MDCAACRVVRARWMSRSCATDPHFDFRCVLGRCALARCAPNCPVDGSRDGLDDGCLSRCPRADEMTLRTERSSCCTGARPPGAICLRNGWCSPHCPTPCASDGCSGICVPDGARCINGNACTQRTIPCQSDGCGDGRFLYPPPPPSVCVNGTVAFSSGRFFKNATRSVVGYPGTLVNATRSVFWQRIFQKHYG